MRSIREILEWLRNIQYEQHIDHEQIFKIQRELDDKVDRMGVPTINMLKALAICERLLKGVDPDGGEE